MRKNNKREERIGEERYNNQGCLMKIIEYSSSKDIIVEFKDKYESKVHANYQAFKKGEIKNPYHPNVCGVGIIGNKYLSSVNGKIKKEYNAWRHMLKRCYDDKYKKRNPAYKDIVCCEKWLLYENFYEWLHNQKNFNKWYDGSLWAVDKDILIKGNKIYSPDTCVLVPNNVNQLFVKENCNRGFFPIGVNKNKGKFQSCCQDNYARKQAYLGSYESPEEAFEVYKQYKENLIKKAAQKEYNKGNITEKCYNAMMNYEVEIND